MTVPFSRVMRDVFFYVHENKFKLRRNGVREDEKDKTTRQKQ